MKGESKNSKIYNLRFLRFKPLLYMLFGTLVCSTLLVCSRTQTYGIEPKTEAVP